MAADDPYRVLGVERDATPEAIRAAYRALAKKHHPDLNPGNKKAEEQFKKVSAANELLSDPEKRARFDRGEIDAAGQEVPPQRPFYRSYGDSRERQKYRAEPGFDPEDLESIFAQAFGGRAGGMGGGAGGGGRGFAARGADDRYALTVSFLDAARGTVRRLTLPDGRTLDVTIPAGLQDGHVLRLKGQGEPGFGDGPPGDALVEITVAPHPRFRREGDDIVLTLPVTLREAVLGATLLVPTLKGEVRLTIPPGSGDGTRLRLRGRGIRDGHQFVELDVVVPPGEEPELAAFLRDWTPRTRFDPRAGLDEEERE
jgi:DnaJ-class molecular chaperone